MRLPRFLRRRRVVELDPEQARGYLLLYARCGGAPTLAEFASMPSELAELLAECRRTVRAEDACAIARASSGPEGFAEILGMVDREAVAGSLLGAALDAGALRVGEVVP